MNNLLVTVENIELVKRLYGGCYPSGLKAGDELPFKDRHATPGLFVADVAYHAANMERERILDLLVRLTPKECGDHTAGGYEYPHNPLKCKECRKQAHLGSCYDKDELDAVIASLCERA